MWTAVEGTAFLVGLALLRSSKVISRENPAPSVIMFALKHHPSGMRISGCSRFLSEDNAEHAQGFSFFHSCKTFLILNRSICCMFQGIIFHCCQSDFYQRMYDSVVRQYSFLQANYGRYSLCMIYVL